MKKKVWKTKKKMVQTLKWATAHLSIRLGAGRAGHGAGRWARDMGAQAGPSWVHCTPDSILTLFLDSVLFLSQFLDIVHEPDS